MSTNSMILLKIVAANGSLLPLRQRGLTPSQITVLIQKQVEAGTLEASVDGIRLTPAGRNALEQYYKAHNVSGPAQWILQQECHYRAPLSRSAVILPRKKR